VHWASNPITQQSAALLFGLSLARSDHGYAPQDFFRVPISSTAQRVQELSGRNITSPRAVRGMLPLSLELTKELILVGWLGPIYIKLWDWRGKFSLRCWAVSGPCVCYLATVLGRVLMPQAVWEERNLECSIVLGRVWADGLSPVLTCALAANIYGDGNNSELASGTVRMVNKL
jgi:hypothetical protein